MGGERAKPELCRGRHGRREIVCSENQVTGMLCCLVVNCWLSLIVWLCSCSFLPNVRVLLPLILLVLTFQPPFIFAARTTCFQHTFPLFCPVAEASLVAHTPCMAMSPMSASVLCMPLLFFFPSFFFAPASQSFSLPSKTTPSPGQPPTKAGQGRRASRYPGRLCSAVALFSHLLWLLFSCIWSYRYFALAPACMRPAYQVRARCTEYDIRTTGTSFRRKCSF